MRIAITVDPYLPVPPRHYGGIERVVNFVVRGLIERGHTVTLFAHPASDTPAVLVPYGIPPHTGTLRRARELRQLGYALWRRHREFDAVVSWGRLAALVPILGYRRLAKVQRYCRDSVPWRSVAHAVRLGGSSIRFAGASGSVYRERPRRDDLGGRWHTLYDGVEVGKYPMVQKAGRDAPLVFLGRLEKIKGVHSAIAIAKAAGRRLVIAGNRVTDTPDANRYFEQEIAPHIDGASVTYIGEVDDAGKAKLLGSAFATLFPTQWKEAFGIVMAESFACGTPVIAFPYGSVPEVVRDGVNGFICADVGEAVEALSRVESLDRARIRADCEERFSDKVVVEALEALLVDAVRECQRSGRVR